eukprot:8189070-Ditylum_brightwellii.AAC.1
MAYRRYTNLCERFRGDLISKLNADVESLDFMDRPCNYNKTSCVNGECAYKGYYKITNDSPFYGRHKTSINIETSLNFQQQQMK